MSEELVHYYIPLSDLDKERWKSILYEHFRKKGKLTEAQIVKKTEEVIKECQEGWSHAPSDLAKRIGMKTGYKWISHENLRRGPFDSVQPTPELLKSNAAGLKVEEAVSEAEKKFIEERRGAYIDEFDFNKSSDEMLLRQLLIFELMLHRLNIKELLEGMVNYSRQMGDIQKNILDIQTKLGITREQRAGQLNNVDGNVAELALLLDEKLNKIADTEGKYKTEEEQMEFLKIQRPPNNIIPPEEKIEALLRGGETKDTIPLENLKEVNLQEVNIEGETKKQDDSTSPLDSEGAVIPPAQ